MEKLIHEGILEIDGSLLAISGKSFKDLLLSELSVALDAQEKQVGELKIPEGCDGIRMEYSLKGNTFVMVWDRLPEEQVNV